MTTWPIGAVYRDLATVCSGADVDAPDFAFEKLLLLWDGRLLLWGAGNPGSHIGPAGFRLEILSPADAVAWCRTVGVDPQAVERKLAQAALTAKRKT